MRGEQLAGIARRHGSRRVRYSPTTRNPRNAILFLTKNALHTLSADHLDELRRRGNTLLFDVLDQNPPTTTEDFADAIVAASMTAHTDFTSQFAQIPTFLVNHHVDVRLASLPLPTRADQFRAAYFGELKNTIRSEALDRQVDYVPVSTSERSDAWLRRLPEYTLHFAIREHIGRDLHKPFLKGFTAAHCGANILIQDSEAEAVEWLGADYPYLLRQEPTEARVAAALEAARESFGTAEWKDGLARMNDIRMRTTPERIADELERLFVAFD